MIFIGLLLTTAALAAPSNPTPPDARPAKPAPRDTGVVWNTCEGEEGAETCDKWDPILSDIDAATRGRSSEVLAALKLDYFGKSDCRTYVNNGLKKRELSSITHVVIHNGGNSAAQNSETFTCRPGASHYTIQRDGAIYQHMGEEWASPHAEGPGANKLAEGINAKSIGIELNIPRMKGASCNELDWNAKLDDVLAACEPTQKQYEALAALLKDIADRTGVVLDDKHVLGHCELTDGGRFAHADPRALSWRRIGLSNSAKLDALKQQTADGTGHGCLWYLAYDEFGNVDRELSKNGTAAYLKNRK